MTPAQIIALIRDTAVVCALAFLVWRIYSDGENAVKLRDIQAVQTQIAANAQIQSRWAEEARNAENQHRIDMDDIRARVAAHADPILVQPPSGTPRAYSVSADTTKASRADPQPAADGSGSRVDLRPAITAFELKYEQALADCRDALNRWPQ